MRTLGHRVHIATSYAGERADCMVAIHAFRSAAAIAAFRNDTPAAPLIVLLAGTDIYRFQQSHPATTLESMQAADKLVGLHDLVCHDIPARFADKLTIIHQSARPLSAPRQPAITHFDVCVVGHLRDEKDPLRTALAARELPTDSRIRIVHLGKARNADWEQAARAEMARNARYIWHGEVSPGEVRRRFARSHLMVISSVMEGGANVVSEAVVAGLPVVASDIPGNVGLLGADHPGYFPVGDASALAQRLYDAETQPAFLARIRAHGEALAPRFHPERELGAWRALLASYS